MDIDSTLGVVILEQVDWQTDLASKGVTVSQPSTIAKG